MERGRNVVESAPLGGSRCHSSEAPDMPAGFLDFTSWNWRWESPALSWVGEDESQPRASLEVGPEMGALPGPQLMGVWEGAHKLGAEGTNACVAS